MILIDEINADLKKTRPELPSYSASTSDLASLGHDSASLVSSASSSTLRVPSSAPSTLKGKLRASPSATSLAAPSAPPPGIQPTNNLYIHRENAAIRGTYVIDPALAVPACVLPPLAPGEPRRNVALVTRNGSVSADVWVAQGFARRRASGSSGSGSGGGGADAAGEEREAPGGDGADGAMQRADVRAESENGSVMLRLHAPPYQRLRVFLCASNGSACVELPRTFSGPVWTHADGGSLHFSPALEGAVTPFSAERRNGRYFIGDYSAWSTWSATPSSPPWGQSWDGDELHLESRGGSLRVSYIDEPSCDVPRANGLFVKLRNMTR